MDPDHWRSLELCSFSRLGSLPPGGVTPFEHLVASQPNVPFRLLISARLRPRGVAQLSLACRRRFPRLGRFWDPQGARQIVVSQWFSLPLDAAHSSGVD